MSDLHEHDIDALHRAVLREREEPIEGREPVPKWMVAIFAGLIGWSGWYLGRYDARFDFDRTDMQPLAGAPAPAPAGLSDDDLAAKGAQVFASRCAACHQPEGQGMAKVAPPLAGSEWVLGDEERLIRVVMHGLTGPIEVKGEPWDGSMPPWGASLTDDEIAGVLTHLRRSWGNDAPAVPVAAVEAARTTERSTPWTAPEL